MKKQLTFKNDKSDKFWHIETAGNSFTVTYGKTGTDGQTQTKTFGSEAECEKAAEKLVNEKLKKGYIEGDSENSEISNSNAMEKKALIKEMKKNFKEDMVDLISSLLEEDKSMNVDDEDSVSEAGDDILDNYLGNGDHFSDCIKELEDQGVMVTVELHNKLYDELDDIYWDVFYEEVEKLKNN